MLDLNHILLFIAYLSPAVVIARTWRKPAQNRSWRLAAAFVLTTAFVAYAIAPRIAGFVGGTVWLLLLFLPAFGMRKAAQLSVEERFRAARRLLGPLRFLHPAKSLRDGHLLARGLELAQHGDARAAAIILDRLSGEQAPAGRRAAAHSLRLRGDWAGLVAWSRQNLPRVGLGEDPALLLLYFRALGEVGLRDDLVLQFAGRAPAMLASPLHQPVFLSGLLVVLAFCGRAAAVQRLLQRSLRQLPAEAKEFWIATGESAAGELDRARERFERLRSAPGNAILRAETEGRLRRLRDAAPAPLALTSASTVARLEREVDMRRSSLLAPQTRPTAAVSVLIALNVAMFLLEIFLGGSTNPYALHRLGALEPAAVLGAGEYWRMLAALFLHYGALHLLVNLYALYVLGPSLEASIGTVRFALCYVISGLGSSAGVIALWRFGLTQADFLVGASGAVMGIVGAWAGLLARHRHMPMARRRLLTIGVIVAIQTGFDLYTPQISMAAHLCGLGTGLLVGLIISPAASREAL